MVEAQVHALVDGRAFADASAYRGIGSYVRAVVGGLAARSDLRISALVRKGTLVPEGVAPLRVLRAAPGRWQDRQHHLLLPLDLLRTPADVVFSPAMDPPAYAKQPWVQTIHDLIPMQGPASSDSTRFRRRAARFREATALIAVSQWTADEIIRQLDVDPRKIHVIPHGVAARFSPAVNIAEKPYVLFVGEYDPRKRHELAYAAVAMIAAGGLPHTLKVTGRIAPWFAARMATIRSESPRPDLVEFLGHVTESALVDLYRGASALVVTSQAEGFGLPALEAMACGTPVVGFANTATTDVVGLGGLLVQDGDVVGLGEALMRVLKDERFRHELSEAALEQASRFTWERSVGEHAEVLMAAAR